MTELKLTWEAVIGSTADRYVQAEYRGMHCEMFHNNRLGTVPVPGWEWSFYDDASPDPDLAVSRSDDLFPTKEEAEADLIDYIDGYEGARS